MSSANEVPLPVEGRFGIVASIVSRALLVVALLGLTGFTAYSSKVQNDQGQQIAHIVKGVDADTAVIKNVTTGQGAMNSRALSLWYAEELQAIFACASPAHVCTSVPLPTIPQHKPTQASH